MFRILSRKPAVVRLCRLVSSEPVSTHINDILSTHLGISDNTLKKITKYEMDTVIYKIPSEQIIVNCKTIQSMSVNLEDVAFLSHCLAMQPIIMKTRIRVLKEIGVKSIGLDDIYRFPTLMRKSLKAFKAAYNISNTESIAKNMFANVGISIDDITASEMEYKYKARIGLYYQQCIFHYKTVHLKLNKKLFNARRRTKYQSLAQISELIHILKNEYNLTHQFFEDHPHLLQLNVDNVKEFVAMGKSLQLNGRNITDVVKKYPRLLGWHTSKVQELLELEKALGTESRGLHTYIQVLRMNKQKFLERYINIANNYELSLWLQHSSVLDLIYRYNSILNRIQYLKPLNCIKQPNIHTYLSSRKFFTRFVEGDVERQATKLYFKYILRKELGEDNVSLMNSIVKHPHWKHVPLLCVRDTLQYLKEHFTVEEICQNIHIILYPRSKVINELNLVKSKGGVEIGYDFTPNQHLALCLYQLEKKCHFSGDGIWETMNAEMPDYDSSCFEDKEERTCEN